LLVLNVSLIIVQVSYVLIVQPPEEKDKTDESGMNVYDFDADGDVDFGDSDGMDDDKSKVKPTGKRSQTVYIIFLRIKKRKVIF
jgi:hypothetical protein